MIALKFPGSERIHLSALSRLRIALSIHCNVSLRSILTRPWLELGGKVNISCSKTGFSSSITFHTKPLYGGVRDHVTGEIKHLPSGRVVCRINGQWTEKIEMTFPDRVVRYLLCFIYYKFVSYFHSPSSVAVKLLLPVQFPNELMPVKIYFLTRLLAYYLSIFVPKKEM